MGNHHIHKKRKKNKKDKLSDNENSQSVNVNVNNFVQNTLVFIEHQQDIPPELKKFQSIFPCLLKANSKGEIESFNSCLNEIPIGHIKFIEENKYSANECETNLSIIDDNDYSIGISVLLNDSKFNLLSGDPEKMNYTISSKSIIIKKKLYSISIREEDIVINDNYKHKLENIANDKTLYDHQKAEKLDGLLKDSGFLVPLKAYVGGLYSFNSENLSEDVKKEFLSNIELDLNFSKKNLNGKNSNDGKKIFTQTKTFSQINRFKIGGNTNTSFEEWVETIDLKNSNIIEYTELRGIDSFIDDDLKKKLEKPISLVWAKYKRRYNYFKVIKELQKYTYKGKNYRYFKNRTDSLKLGICDKNIPDIYVDNKESFFVDSSFLSIVTKNVFYSSKDIIVGIEIINKCKKAEYGHFTGRSPILSKEVNFAFESARGEELKFDINIYLMKFPN